MTTKAMIVLALIAMAGACKKQTTGIDTTPPAEPDTTSHDIIWRVDTIGAYGSILRDVAIINDSLIWACGELRDSVGDLYGAAIWNGKEWKLKKLVDQYGAWIRPDGIWAFSENNIWTATGVVHKWNGEKITRLWPSTNITAPFGVTKIWAANENSIFFVGRGGAALHYNGSSFSQMETGTDIDLTDVWGTSENDVWACGYTRNEGKTIIIHYDGVHWVTFFKPKADIYYKLNTNILSGPIVSIWTDHKNILWAVTFWGLYRINNKNASDFIRYPIERYHRTYVEKVRGSHRKDIIFCGSPNSLWHYNGNNAIYYQKFSDSDPLLSVAMKDKLIIAVGLEYQRNRAIAITGVR